MFLMLAARESAVMSAAVRSLELFDADSVVLVTESLLEFRERPISNGLTIALNGSFWALLVGVFFLLFFWRGPPASDDLEQHG